MNELIKSLGSEERVPVLAQMIDIRDALQVALFDERMHRGLAEAL